MDITRTYLNFKSLNVSTAYKMTKAKRDFLKTNDHCAICGYKKKLEVHHIIPVHIDPSLSCDNKNFITLCRTCHFTFGHFHNFRKYWNTDIVIMAENIKDFYDETYSKIIVLNANQIYHN